MIKEELVMAFAGGKRPFNPKKKKSPPRDVADLTCPNCNEKGHTGQDCPKPKVELSKRKCFICGTPGCVAKTCPKKKAAATALTNDAGGDGGTGNAWFGCVADSCCAAPNRAKHRRRMQSWQAATEVASRAPTGFTLGDAMGGVFAQMARLEAAEETLYGCCNLSPTKVEDSKSMDFDEVMKEAEQPNDTTEDELLNFYGLEEHLSLIHI